MVLKVDEKQERVSIASISQRRGITSAYAGDALASAAESIGGMVNAFAKRKSELLDVEYRAKASADHAKALTEFAREHRVDPEAFMNKANAYYDKAIEQAPTRYKGWTKGLLNNEISSKGDVIWTRWNQKSQTDALAKFEENYSMVLENISQNIGQQTPDTLDGYILNNTRLNIAEQSEQYAKLYNASDPSIQNALASSLGTPENFTKNMQLYVEAERLKSIVMFDAEGAMSVDIANLNSNADMLALGISNKDLLFNQFKQGLQNKLNQYVQDPSSIESESTRSVFINSTEEERAVIAKSIMESVNNASAKYENEYEKIANIQAVNVKNTEANIENKLDLMDNDIMDMTNKQFNMTFGSLPNAENLQAKHMANKRILNLIPNLDMGANVDTIASSLIEDPVVREVYENSQEIIQVVADQKFNRLFNPSISEITYKQGFVVEEILTKPATNINAKQIDLLATNAAGEFVYQNQLNDAAIFIARNNVLPEAISNAFKQQKYFDIKDPMAFKKGQRLGKLASAIKANGFLPDGMTDEDIITIDNWDHFNRITQEMDVSLLEDQQDKDALEYTKRIALSYTRPPSQSFESAVVNYADQVFDFDDSKDESKINLVEFLHDNDLQERYSNRGILKTIFTDPYDRTNAQQLMPEIKTQFIGILTNDLKNYYSEDSNINVNNYTDNTLPNVPAKFRTAEYITKTIEKALYMSRFAGLEMAMK